MSEACDISVIVPCYNANRYLNICLESLKAQRVQLRDPVALRQVRPRDEKDVSHAHAAGAAVERIAPGAREQDGVHPQRGGGAENRAGVVDYSGKR